MAGDHEYYHFLTKDPPKGNKQQPGEKTPWQNIQDADRVSDSTQRSPRGHWKDVSRIDDPAKDNVECPAGPGFIISGTYPDVVIRKVVFDQYEHNWLKLTPFELKVDEDNVSATDSVYDDIAPNRASHHEENYQPPPQPQQNRQAVAPTPPPKRKALRRFVDSEVYDDVGQEPPPPPSVSSAASKPPEPKPNKGKKKEKKKKKKQKQEEQQQLSPDPVPQPNPDTHSLEPEYEETGPAYAEIRKKNEETQPVEDMEGEVEGAESVTSEHTAKKSRWCCVCCG